MAKRYRRVKRVYSKVKRRASKMTIPLAVVGGVMAMPAFGYLVTNAQQGNIDGMRKSIGHIAGVGDSGKFSYYTLKENMIPLIAGVLVHKIAGFAGVNRLIASAKIPLVRI